MQTKKFMSHSGLLSLFGSNERFRRFCSPLQTMADLQQV
jgi:hypothetical protein